MMHMVKTMTATEAVHTYVKDGHTLAFAGFVGAVHAEEISKAIQESYLSSGHPKDLTLLYAAGQGDGKERQLNHLGEEGLVTKVIGGHWGLQPRLQKLALENKLAAYNLPQGVISQMFRDIAAGKPGVITHVGLKTFVDPRLEGGKLNDKAREVGDIVEVVHLRGEEKLFYHSHPIDVAVIRATYADTKGNCTLQREGVIGEALSIAQAAKNSGGKVIVQVKNAVRAGSLTADRVEIPGIFVDAVVVSPDPIEEHRQTKAYFYDPSMSGHINVPVDSIPPLPLDVRKVLARRAAMELTPHAVINLGIGVPEGVAVVAAEEGFGDQLTMTTESGVMGGIPCGGGAFGAGQNALGILDMRTMFDFYDGGGLDMTVLGLAEVNAKGDINVGRFGPKTPGCGGFINISQNTGKVVFCGSFTSGGLELEIGNGALHIIREGRNRKFVETVQQVTYSGEYGASIGQEVLYVTERAVFRLTRAGIVLTEIAPGVDLQKDVLDQMGFLPILSKDLKQMDPRIFQAEKMGLTI